MLHVTDSILSFVGPNGEHLAQLTPKLRSLFHPILRHVLLILFPGLDFMLEQL